MYNFTFAVLKFLLWHVCGIENEDSLHVWTSDVCVHMPIDLGDVHLVGWLGLIPGLSRVGTEGFRF